MTNAVYPILSTGLLGRGAARLEYPGGGFRKEEPMNEQVDGGVAHLDPVKNESLSPDTYVPRKGV